MMILNSFHHKLVGHPPETLSSILRKGAMRSTISFILDGTIVSESFSRISPTTTLLNYLRGLPTHKGVKEGCAEGDCGACTVVLGSRKPDGSLRYASVDSCLVFLPMLHGKQVITVENLQDTSGALHPVQQTMVETGGSQCGYCTPGIVMSVFSLYKNHNRPGRADIDDALTGNLCRCTGYRPIIEAAAQACVHERLDAFSASENDTADMLASIAMDSATFRHNAQRYFQPATLEEALAIKKEYPDAIVISGATDIALRVTKRHDVLERILDLGLVEELRSVKTREDGILFGSSVTLTDALAVAEEPFPSLAATLHVFGSQQIRNLATIGGNLGTASPIGDLLSSLIPLDAIVTLQNVNGKREVPLNTFVTGYRLTIRKPDELITGIFIPYPSHKELIRWYKVSKRKDLDISTVSAGIRIALDDMRRVTRCTIAYGGMADRVKQASAAEAFLAGRVWDRQTVENAMPLIDNDFKPISDARGSAEFRSVVAKNLLLKFWADTRELTNGEAGTNV